MTDNQWFQLEIGKAMKSKDPKNALGDLGMDLMCKRLIIEYMIHYADNDDNRDMYIKAKDIVYSQLNTVAKLITDMMTEEKEDEKNGKDVY